MCVNKNQQKAICEKMSIALLIDAAEFLERRERGTWILLIKIFSTHTHTILVELNAALIFFPPFSEKEKKIKQIWRIFRLIYVNIFLSAVLVKEDNRKIFSIHIKFFFVTRYAQLS